MIGKRKDIPRVEVRSAHVSGTNVGLEIGLGLISAVNVSTEGKPCREIMRKRRSEVHIFVVRAHIEKLSKASDSKQTNVCLFPRVDYKSGQGFLSRKTSLGCLSSR